MVNYRMYRQRRRRTPAEEVANTDDLLTEILKRLPTKTLLQYKLVSKQWLSLISSPHFSISHTRFLQKEGFLKPSALFLDVIYRQPPTKFMFLPFNSATKQLPLFDFMNAPYLKIMQSCTGLLLCISGYGNPSYFICNPVIKKFKAISFPRHLTLDYQLVGVNLAFDPLKSPYYKIISVWQEALLEKDEENNCLRYMSSNFSIDIYSSKTDSWSVSKIKFTSNRDIKFDHAVLLNGSIYWDSTDRESLYFDVEKECLMPMPMPKLRRRYSGFRYFGESGGYLHLVVGRRPVYYLIFRIFEMLVDRSGWFPKYRIDLEVEMLKLNIIPHYDGYDLLWFAFHSDEDGGDSMVALIKCGLKLVYNFKDEELKVLVGCPKAEKYQHDYDRFRGCPYFETLSCV
ncbi:F-box protein At5g07610-like [Durio zibethinus]|uniref:F-box protein At5g07610-like n=1 Tax=Durio zibethinus TaxID=66656 RepID=A0A6P5Z540_DURZI|nr:F-box protein At5g07610-like [Durio zibethinus]